MRRIQIAFVMIIVSALLASSCVVSKKDYLLKEDEASRCTDNLRMQVEENKTLRGELSECQEDLSTANARVEELTTSLARVSSEKDELESRLTVQQAINEELKTQNERLTDILQKKEVSQSAIIKETMEINKRLQGVNVGLREKLAVAGMESGRLEKERNALKVRNAELEKQKDDYLRLAAEFANFRNRRIKERSETWNRAQADMMGTLLESIDDLARVTELDPNQVSVADVVSGVD